MRADSPTPEQLAAYADGELDGRDALAPLRANIERWLREHPEARAELDQQRRLRRAWDATSPPEPSEAVWSRILARLADAKPQPALPRSVRRIAWIAAGVAAAAVLFLVLQSQPPAPLPPAPRDADEENVLLDDGEPLQVATTDEIEILSVDGADTATLVVHDLPSRKPIELLRPGEVSLAQPMRDPMVQVRLEGATPMIWARLDSEMDDD